MTTGLIIGVLRLLHVLGGIFWVGATAFIGFFLMPSVRALGPGGGAILNQIGSVRRLPRYMMSAAITTVLSGLALYWVDSAGFDSAWMHSGPGRVFGLGGLFGITAALFGTIMVHPLGERLSALAASAQAGGRTPAPEEVAELRSVQDQLTRRARVGGALLMTAAAAMAVARYVG